MTFSFIITIQINVVYGSIFKSPLVIPSFLSLRNVKHYILVINPNAYSTFFKLYYIIIQKLIIMS